jgi:hypothetical protein
LSGGGEIRATMGDPGGKLDASFSIMDRELLDLEPPRSRRRLWRNLLVIGLLLLFASGSACIGFYFFGKRPLPPSGGSYFFKRVELQVPLFLQGDPAWGDEHLGTSPRTMAQVGCAVCAATMIMKYYGIDTDPGRMNDFLMENGGYDENNDLLWEGPAKIAPDKVRHVYEDLPSYFLIDSNLDKGNPVIVRLRLRSGWTHFVVIMGKQGFDYLIRDPSSAGRTKGIYPLREIGSNIEALRFYQPIGGGKT